MVDVANLEPLKLWDRFREWRLLRRNVRAVLRLLYLECLKNVELLKCVHLDKAPQSDADLLAVIPRMETSMLEFVFLQGEKNTSLFRILSHRSRVVRHDDEDEKPESRHEVPLLHAVVFVYLKIDVLRRLATIQGEGEGEGDGQPRGKGLKKIRYRTRLANVRQNLDEIIQVLERQKELRSMQVRKLVGY